MSSRRHGPRPTPQPQTPETSRTLVFTKGMQEATTQRAIAVAWITQHQPNSGYECSDVAYQMGKDLRRQGFTDTDRRVLQFTMKWLAAEGYAIRSVIKGKTRMFVMDSDIVVPEPVHLRARRAMGDPATVHHIGPDLDPETVTTAGVTPPPLPHPRAPRPEWMAVLEDGLLAWHRTDPDAARQWGEAAIAALAPPSAGSVGA